MSEPSAGDQLAAHALAWVRAAWDEGWPEDPKRRTLLALAMSSEATLLAPFVGSVAGELTQRFVRIAQALHRGGWAEGTPMGVAIQVVATLDPCSPEVALRLIESAEMIAQHPP